jgi:hypothetical protein
LPTVDRSSRPAADRVADEPGGCAEADAGADRGGAEGCRAAGEGAGDDHPVERAVAAHPRQPVDADGRGIDATPPPRAYAHASEGAWDVVRASAGRDNAPPGIERAFTPADHR